MAHAHIPVLAPHSLEPADRALLPADCYQPWLGADTQTLSMPSWAVHSMAEGVKAERGREWSLGCVASLCLDWHHIIPMGCRQRAHLPQGSGLSLATRGLGNSGVV